MGRKLPAATVERGLELVAKGYGFAVAAEVVGCSDRVLRTYLRRRGQDAATLRAAAGPRHLRRYPCRYCDAPVPDRDGVCRAPACRERVWATLPPEERQARVDRRRRTRRVRGEEPDHYARHVADGRRVDVHILLAPAAAEQLREQAALRGQSISSLVAEALAEVGLIDEV